MGFRQQVRIRQRDATDCGPACIASVLSHYRVMAPVARIRQLAGTDRSGTSMWGMIKALEKFSFVAKGLSGSAEHLSRLPVPFIAHLNIRDRGDHYVCVYRVKQDHLRIMDPQYGRMERWTQERFNRDWSGAVIALVEGIPGLSKGSGHPPPFLRIMMLLHPVRNAFVQALTAASLCTLLGLSTSIYLGQLTDHVLFSSNRGMLNLMSMVMVFVILFSVYLYGLKNLLVLKTGQIIDNQLICRYFRHLFRLPQRFFDSMMTGEILSRVSDAVKIRGFINDALIGILVNSLTLLFALVTMLLLNVQLALLVCGLVPPYLLIYFLYNRKNRKTEREAMERVAEFEGQVVESLQSSVFIRQYNLAEANRDRIEGRLNRLLDTLYRSGTNLIRSSAATEFLNRALTLALLWVGANQVMEQHLSPGTLMSFYALMGYFTGPVTHLIGANKSFQNALIAADRLFEILELEPERISEKPPFRMEDFGDIEFHRVTFSYGTRNTLFRELDLLIPSGKVTLISGSSGSGKSSIASLLQHLYLPENGRITINGKDTRHYSGESLRRMMGVVPQQVRLTSGTLLENLVPGASEPDMGRVEDLITELGLDLLVAGLSQGLMTPLTENGANLSGGERQRIAIARALYRDPPLLILDEATASLDPGSAARVRNIMHQLKKQAKTILWISHENQEGGFVDRRLFLDRGRITGNHS